MAYRKVSGIYEIVNLANGKRYVGSAASIRARWASHIHLLNAGKHHSIHLQRAWRKHGPEGFAFRELEAGVAVADLIAREQFYIDSLAPEYNIAIRAGSSVGTTHSEETRAKVGAAAARAWQDPAYREKMMTSRSAVWDDPERREKGRAASKRMWADPEYRAKMAVARANQKLPPDFGEAVKRGIAERKAKGLPFARQINPCIGRVTTEETKEKLRQAILGMRHSDEARRKMSDARKGRKIAPRSD